MLKSINWKLIGLFFIKMFLYLLVIPLIAAIIYVYKRQVIFPLLFHVDRTIYVSKSIMSKWTDMVFFTSTVIFYIYVYCIRYLKSKFKRRLMLILFVLIPGILGGIELTIDIHLTILGNLVYNSTYYLFYYLCEYWLPSFRGKLSSK